jgi:hypothetical protein
MRLHAGMDKDNAHTEYPSALDAPGPYCKNQTRTIIIQNVASAQHEAVLFTSLQASFVGYFLGLSGPANDTRLIAADSIALKQNAVVRYHFSGCKKSDITDKESLEFRGRHVKISLQLWGEYEIRGKEYLGINDHVATISDYLHVPLLRFLLYFLEVL